MKANLITDSEAFMWQDLSIDRSFLIDDLLLSQICAQDHGDVIFSSPSLITLELKWGALYELTIMSHAETLEECPWLTRDHQILLAKIINGNTTPNNSATLGELQNEFPKMNNAWFGLQPRDLPRYVHNEESWRNLHHENVREFYHSIDKGTEYFKRFYVAKLTIGSSTLKRSIEKGREHPIFKRLDIPTVIENETTLHGEQIQIHFNDEDKSALNLNGEWKHGKFDIPRKARIQLIKWGFIVPD